MQAGGRRGKGTEKLMRSLAEAGWRQGSVGRLLCSWKSSSPKEKAQPQGCGCIPSTLSTVHQQRPAQDSAVPGP